MKKIIAIAITLLLVGCVTPPLPKNDPNIEDRGEIIIRVNDDPRYDYWTQCYPPYQIGPYCDMYYDPFYRQHPRPPGLEFRLKP